MHNNTHHISSTNEKPRRRAWNNYEGITARITYHGIYVVNLPNSLDSLFSPKEEIQGFLCMCERCPDRRWVSYEEVFSVIRKLRSPDPFRLYAERDCCLFSAVFEPLRRFFTTHWMDSNIRGCISNCHVTSFYMLEDIDR